MKQKLGKLQLVRKNLYRDEHKRNLYIDFNNHKIYVIEKNDDKKFEYLQMRLLISILIAIVSSYFLNWWIGLLIGVLLIAFSEWYYRYKFLQSLQTIEVDSFPEKESTVKSFVSKGNTINLIRSIVGAIIPFLAAYVAYERITSVQTMTIMDKALTIIGCFAIACYGVYTCYFSIKALKYTKGN